ncbi:MAG: hypothetical protein Q3985_07355 [Eubacteriales bacterium]|nr:hypothetical protein [Eubacteriales bacterium]
MEIPEMSALSDYQKGKLNGALHIFSVHEGMTVRFDGFEAVITEIGKKEDSGYVCPLRSDQTIPDGFYEGKIIIKCPGRGTCWSALFCSEST